MQEWMGDALKVCICNSWNLAIEAILMEYSKLSLKFRRNPNELKKWVDKIVEITTVEDEVIVGRVYTIDPISESIVVFRVEENKGVADIVMGHAVKCIKLSSCEVDIPMLAIFKTQNAVVKSEEHEVKREKIKNWLLRNRIPIEEDGETLVVNKTLKIYPPYGCDQCTSANTITLDKIQRLLSQLPDE